MEPHEQSPDHERVPLVSEHTSQELDIKLEELQAKELEQRVRERAARTGELYISLVGTPISPEALALLPEAQARALGAVPFLYVGNEVRLGVVDTRNPQLESAVAAIAVRVNARVQRYLISDRSFRYALTLYQTLPKIQVVETGVSLHAEDLAQFDRQLTSFRDLGALAAKTPVTHLIALVLAGAMRSEASDIHLESGEESVSVRYRLDGLLQQVATLPKSAWPTLISRIKLLAHLKLNVSSESQDGSFSIHLPGDRLEVRVSTVPTAFGESVALRLLRSSQSGLKFEDLGLRGRSYTELLRESGRPNGMVLTTGPTGSGKTTTLYAILNRLNSPEVKIATLEDPIEYRLAGINQSQVNPGANYTFARGLRAILRQDPDIIMVGEIRDEETAETAVNAALTGHLVISTMHTNDAAGALPRLLALGVKPFLLAPAINAIMGQRLLRKICEQCRTPATLEPELLARVQSVLRAIPAKSGSALTEEELQQLTFAKGSGCDSCHHLGYRHRTGIYEVFSMTPEIEQVILSGQVSEYQVRELAIKGGMVAMVQDGLLKAKDGITTVEEVFRVVE